VQAGVWRCNGCGGTFTDGEMNVECEYNGASERLFVVEKKVELLVHQLMQISPTLDDDGELAPRLRGGRVPHMLEAFHQVSG
jgi:hypothetical protein